MKERNVCPCEAEKLLEYVVVFVCSQKEKSKELRSSSVVSNVKEHNTNTLPVVTNMSNLSNCKCFVMLVYLV